MHGTEQAKLEELSEEIWALTEFGENSYEKVIRGSKIAEAESVVERMRREGLVVVPEEGAGMVRLTTAGAEIAISVVRRHRLAEMLFSQVLALDESTTESTACEVEHILSPAVTDSVCAFLGHPPRCPHGKPIPPGRCCNVFKRDLDPLIIRMLDLRVGETGKVVFMRSLNPGRLDRVATLGLRVGATLRLRQKQPSVVLEVGQTTLALDREIADKVYVRRLPDAPVSPWRGGDESGPAGDPGPPV